MKSHGKPLNLNFGRHLTSALVIATLAFGVGCANKKRGPKTPGNPDAVNGQTQQPGEVDKKTAGGGKKGGAKEEKGGSKVPGTGPKTKPNSPEALAERDKLVVKIASEIKAEVVQELKANQGSKENKEIVDAVGVLKKAMGEKPSQVDALNYFNQERVNNDKKASCEAKLPKVKGDKELEAARAECDKIKAEAPKKDAKKDKKAISDGDLVALVEANRIAAQILSAKGREILGFSELALSGEDKKQIEELYAKAVKAFAEDQDDKNDTKVAAWNSVVTDYQEEVSKGWNDMEQISNILVEQGVAQLSVEKFQAKALAYLKVKADNPKKDIFAKHQITYLAYTVAQAMLRPKNHNGQGAIGWVNRLTLAKGDHQKTKEIVQTVYAKLAISDQAFATIIDGFRKMKAQQAAQTGTVVQTEGKPEAQEPIPEAGKPAPATGSSVLSMVRSAIVGMGVAVSNMTEAARQMHYPIDLRTWSLEAQDPTAVAEARDVRSFAERVMGKGKVQVKVWEVFGEEDREKIGGLNYTIQVILPEGTSMEQSMKVSQELATVAPHLAAPYMGVLTEAFQVTGTDRDHDPVPSLRLKDLRKAYGEQEVETEDLVYPVTNVIQLNPKLDEMERKRTLRHIATLIQNKVGVRSNGNAKFSADIVGLIGFDSRADFGIELHFGGVMSPQEISNLSEYIEGYLAATEIGYLTVTRGMRENSVPDYLKLPEPIDYKKYTIYFSLNRFLSVKATKSRIYGVVHAMIGNGDDGRWGIEFARKAMDSDPIDGPFFRVVLSEMINEQEMILVKSALQNDSRVSRYGQVVTDGFDESFVPATRLYKYWVSRHAPMTSGQLTAKIAKIIAEMQSDVSKRPTIATQPTEAGNTVLEIEFGAEASEEELFEMVNRIDTDADLRGNGLLYLGE